MISIKRILQGTATRSKLRHLAGLQLQCHQGSHDFKLNAFFWMYECKSCGLWKHDIENDDTRIKLMRLLNG